MVAQVWHDQTVLIISEDASVVLPVAERPILTEVAESLVGLRSSAFAGW